MSPTLPRYALIAVVCLAGSRLLFSDPAAPAEDNHDCCLTPQQQEVLAHFSLTYLDNGLGQRARTVRLSGANFQVVNGLGATNGNPAQPDSLNPLETETNGVGNLIVGYNEARAGSLRTGSHNVVVGQGLTFRRFGGIVSGRDSAITGPFASVTGGRANIASGTFASVSGGALNDSSGDASSVSGGRYNYASGYQASVSGGRYNRASGGYAAVSGGEVNHASGWSGSVTGGKGNEASAGFWYTSTVTGGRMNEASGPYSTVSGGFQRTADGWDQWVAGDLSYP